MSLLETAIDNTIDRYVSSPEFKSRITQHVLWTMQGFEPGFGLKDRAVFTASVAQRFHAKGRNGRVLGFLWLKRIPLSKCADLAERTVTDWLRDERVKFGDARYDWTDGRDLADEEMRHWDA